MGGGNEIMREIWEEGEEEEDEEKEKEEEQQQQQQETRVVLGNCALR